MRVETVPCPLPDACKPSSHCQIGANHEYCDKESQAGKSGMHARLQLLGHHKPWSLPIVCDGL